MEFNGRLLCACNAAYGINPVNGSYTPDKFYEPQVGYKHTPKAIFASPNPGEADINACLVGATSSEIIVAFRGTIFGEIVISLEDWFTDFEADTKSEKGLPGKVHEGFYGDLMTIYPHIIAEIAKLRGTSSTPVYVTGHSKGGGMAPIFAYLLLGEGITPAGVVTFAAPMSGDNDFASGYNAKIANHTRYENCGDLVPLLPPNTETIDAFVSALTPYQSYIPQWLWNMFQKAQTWNYTTVGTEQYIVPDVFETGYFLLANVPVDVIAVDVAANIAAYEFDVESALISAHTSECGHGYFGGLCPSITKCPTKNEDVAAMKGAAPPKQKVTSKAVDTMAGGSSS